MRAVPLTSLLVGACLLWAADLPGQEVLFRSEADGASVSFGGAAARLDDVNGDGLADFAVGDRNHDGQRGRVLILSGADGALLAEIVGADAQDDFGGALARAGDVDGDGVADLIVGASQRATVERRGKVLVFSGASGALLHRFEGGPGQSLGTSVAGPGDLDGDGHAEVLAGGPGISASLPGRARLYDGATGGLIDEWEGPPVLNFFWNYGESVAGAGDVDGDGVGDLLVGASNGANQDGSWGRAVLFSGATGNELGMLLPPEEFSYSAGFARVVAGVGDVDLDGLDDVAVAAEDGLRGVVYVYAGGSGALLHVLDLDHEDRDDFLGRSLTALEDLDGDGRPEIAVGAPHLGLGGIPGEVRVFSGADGRVLYTLGGDPDSQFGVAVTTAGDRNGDGRPDLLVTALAGYAELVLLLPIPLLAVSPLQAGQPATLRLADGNPSAEVWFLASPTGYGVVRAAGFTLGLAEPVRVLARRTVTPAGQASITRSVPSALAGRTFYFQALERHAGVLRGSPVVAATVQ